jgi:hypothetical protein
MDDAAGEKCHASYLTFFTVVVFSMGGGTVSKKNRTPPPSAQGEPLNVIRRHTHKSNFTRDDPWPLEAPNGQEMVQVTVIDFLRPVQHA